MALGSKGNPSPRKIAKQKGTGCLQTPFFKPEVLGAITCWSARFLTARACQKRAVKYPRLAGCQSLKPNRVEKFLGGFCCQGKVASATGRPLFSNRTFQIREPSKWNYTCDPSKKEIHSCGFRKAKGSNQGNPSKKCRWTKTTHQAPGTKPHLTGWKGELKVMH